MLPVACLGESGGKAPTADTARFDADSSDTSDATDTTGADTSAPTDTSHTGDPDADGDGSPDHIDCDDANPLIHPGAVERCDRIDQDCDGAALEPGVCAAPQYAGAMYVATWSTPWPDSGVLPAWQRETADFDGDGIDDLFAYCAGCTEADYGFDREVSVLIRGATDLASANVVDLTTDTWFVGGVLDWGLPQNPSPVADLDGDGVTDLVFAAGDNDSMLGAVWVLRGPDERWGAGPAVRDRADLSWEMAYGDTLFAVGGVVGGDLDGDGRTDLLVAARNENPSSEARVYVLPGRGDTGAQVLDAEPWISTHTDGDDFGTTLFVAGDLDGDGADEVVVREQDSETVYLFHGQDLVHAEDGDADALAAEVWGPAVSPLGCVARAGDLDGDGLDDWIYGSGYASDVAEYGGALFVMSGVRERATVIDPADRSSGWWYGTESRAFLGQGHCTALDFDGDGRTELSADYDIFRLVGLPVGGEPVRVGLRFDDRDDADPDGRYGQVESAADLNGDGYEDLVISGLVDDRSGFVLVPGWEVPWDEAGWW